MGYDDLAAELVVGFDAAGFADEKVADSVRDVAALASPEAASAMKIFTDINEAEAWLGRPLDQIP